MNAVLVAEVQEGVEACLEVSVGDATCGEGVPPWLSALATPGQIGKPLSPLLDILDESHWVPENCHEKTFAECAQKGLRGRTELSDAVAVCITEVTDMLVASRKTRGAYLPFACLVTAAASWPVWGKLYKALQSHLCNRKVIYLIKKP